MSMAKKGGVQQLQTEINTDEDLLKFLEKDGILLLEVYTGWCGPCVAMLSSLKKIKLEKGGDDLLLSIVKADTVDMFERFRNKSEPTWLIATAGKLVNGVFGTNAPELMKCIGDEIDLQKAYVAGETGRTFYELNEMVPCELERYLRQKAIDDHNNEIERERTEQKRTDYIRFVTSEINERMAEMGVTVFMPHTVNKDMMKRLTEYGDMFTLSAKDKKLVTIAEQHLEWINFDIVNPLPDFYLRELYEKDVFMVCWKIPDNEMRPVAEVLHSFCDYLSKPQPIKDDLSDPPINMPPILKPYAMMVDDDELERFKAQETDDDALIRERIISLMMHREAAGMKDDDGDAGGGAAAEASAVADEAPTVDEMGEDEEETQSEEEADEGILMEDVDDGAANVTDSDDDDDDNGKQRLAGSVRFIEKAAEEEEEMGEEEGEKLPDLRTNKVYMLPVWTPYNKVAQAALVYLYFRNQTDHFLAPDPTPDPPHIAIVFDAHKRHEIMELIAEHPDDILAYGYFTSEKPTSAKIIADSTYRYDKIKTKSISDKIVLKVSKKTSHTLLAMTSKFPVYVSLNTRDGETECMHFFPEGYVVGNEGPDEEDEEAAASEIAAAEAAAAEEDADGDVGADDENVEDGAEAEGDLVGEETKDDVEATAENTTES